MGQTDGQIALFQNAPPPIGRDVITRLIMTKCSIYCTGKIGSYCKQQNDTENTSYDCYNSYCLLLLLLLLPTVCRLTAS